MKSWYEENLGLVTNEYGSVFEFRSTDEPDHKGYLVRSPFAYDTKYFEPSTKARQLINENLFNHKGTKITKYF